MSKQVWPVSIGAYSDYTVVMVCETEEIAKQLVALLNSDKQSKWSDDYEVDAPVDLFETGDPMPVKVETWSCWISPDGNVRTESKRQWSHDVVEGGGRNTYAGAYTYGHRTEADAVRAARAWAETPQP